VLVTSRELLRVRGEVEYEVLPLSQPEGVALFCERARVEASAAVEELCRRLDDMPLALELAAARAKVLTPEQIVERLGDRLDLLEGGRDADPRQQTLRATIEWSYDLLDTGEQRLFAGLGVFAGGCVLAAAEAVAEADLDTLQSLVEKSLVRRTGERFWMLETIREYAVERLEALPDAQSLRRRHAEYLLTLGEEASLAAESEGPQRPELVRPELDNFRAAIDWAVEHCPELAFRLVVAVEQVWVTNEPFEGVRRITALLDLEAEVAPVLRARVLRTLGECKWVSGDLEGGTALMEQALAAFERLGDEAAVAGIYERLTAGALMAKDLARARRFVEHCLAICSGRPNSKDHASAIGKLAWIERYEGNTALALELFERSAAMCGQVGFTWMQVNTTLDVADVAAELGRNDYATEQAGQAVRLAGQIHDRQFTIYGLALLARLAVAVGDVERAGRLWGAVEAEEARGPVGYWELGRDEIAAAVVVASPEFESGRSSGRALSLDEAVEYALSVDSPT
jgi:tetratricopeptide (TPR) repeat protein